MTVPESAGVQSRDGGVLIRTRGSSCHRFGISRLAYDLPQRDGKANFVLAFDMRSRFFLRTGFNSLRQETVQMLEVHPPPPAVQSNETIPDCCVTLFSRGEDPDALAGVLAETLGLNRIDAKIRAAHVPGILPDRLTRETADSVVAAVHRIGISAATFARSEIPCLDHPVVVHHASCGSEGLEILGLRGVRTSLVRWPDLEFVSVGHVPLETAHHSNAESLVVVHSAPHSFEETLDQPILSGPECWIIARRPERIFVLNHNRMNYEYLESRMTGSATANFKELLNDLVHYGRAAYFTPATHAILKHGPAHSFTFSDTDQLKRATLVQFLLHRTIETQQRPQPD
jgi:hypothetical protein